MASIRVFLFTFRRNETLIRSINSLLAQTFTNWVCEVHNDDPADYFPEKFIKTLNDTRFSVINHTRNLGPVATFNLAFNNCAEPYISILEDDNWWEPEFLEEMFNVMETHQHVNTSWANMYLWQEAPDSKWTDTKKTIWPVSNERLKIFNETNYRQAIEALHSNGAMLVRNTGLNNLKVPENIRFDFMELARDRAYSYPLLLVNKPLANFSFTLSTTRQNMLDGMYEHCVLAIDSFFKSFENKDALAKELWLNARQKNNRSYLKLLYTGLTGTCSKSLLKYATFNEWFVFALYNIKYPFLLYKCAHAKETYFEVWEYLLKNTAKNAVEIQ